MFLRNPNSVPVALAKGQVTDELAVAALVTTAAYAVEEGRLRRLEELPEPGAHDPPDTSRYVVWEGISITAAGHASGPRSAPFVRLVELGVGPIVRRLAVFGDRVWERALGGGLAASDAQPFDAIELSFARAFGGGFDVPPGVLPGTDLPHPGFRRAHPFNPRGVGLYRDEARALGSPLPSIERPDQLLSRWDDNPEPTGLSPCGDLTGWRLHAEATPRLRAHLDSGGSPTEMPLSLPSFRLQHHAPPDLIFDDLAVGTEIRLSGLGSGPLRFALPPCPARAVVRGRKGEVDVVPRLRAVHMDADRALVLVIHDLAFRYDPRHAPSWVRIGRLPEVSS
jgi:hypothetical protein